MLVKASTAAKGGNVIKVGLIVQIVFFGVFIITSIIFHVKLEKKRVNGAATARGPLEETPDRVIHR
jgi:RTA1 like protein.